MSERQAALDDFLRDSDWHSACRNPLPGDASARKYVRLTSSDGTTSAMLMDAPPGKGLKTGAFIDVGNWLSQNGLSAPKIIKTNREAGFVLMEDLGDTLFGKICSQSPNLEAELYTQAIDVLSALQHLTPPPVLPPYSSEVYLTEARLLTDWYLPAATGNPALSEVRETYAGLMREVCEDLPNDQTCVVLRDYHADNLIWLPERAPLARVGLLDFQDALLGHPAYDLVSLLEDARRDVGNDLRTAMLDHFLESYKQDHGEFRKYFAILGAQRNLKIIGIFTRLCLRDKKTGYLDMIPRVWQHLMRDLSHPALVPLRAFINCHIPEPKTAILTRIREGAK